MKPRLTTTVAMLAALAIGGATVLARQTKGDTVSDLEAAAKAAEDAGRLQEAFDTYVRAVQALPDSPPLDMASSVRETDYRLRERVVLLAMKLQPPPAVPEEAERYAIGGRIAFQEAKSPNGVGEARQQFVKAMRVAPWAPTITFNLALVDEKLEMYEDAINNFRLYLLMSPPDADQIRTKIYEYQYRLDQAKDDFAVDFGAGWWIVTRNRVQWPFGTYVDSGGSTHTTSYTVERGGTLSVGAGVPRQWSSPQEYESFWRNDWWNSLDENAKRALNKINDQLEDSFGSLEVKLKGGAVGTKQTIAGVECDDYAYAFGPVRVTLCVAPTLLPSLTGRTNPYVAARLMSWKANYFILDRIGALVFLAAAEADHGVPLAFAYETTRPRKESPFIPARMSWTATGVRRGHIPGWFFDSK